MRPPNSTTAGSRICCGHGFDQIVDLGHPLARLARSIDWAFLEQRFGAAYSDKPGRPPLPTRLMAGLAILKHMRNLSDEALCALWLENPYYQLFRGEEVFRHTLPFDRSSLTRWRQRMGEEKLGALLQESLHAATRTGAAKPADFTSVVLDTTVQPKAIAFPTDAKLLHRTGAHLVRLAQRHGVRVRQSYLRVGKAALIRHQRYAPAIRTQLGVSLTRVFTNAGYRGHNAPREAGLQGYTAGQKRGVTKQIKREMRRRSTIEPVIGHLKSQVVPAMKPTPCSPPPDTTSACCSHGWLLSCASSWGGHPACSGCSAPHARSQSSHEGRSSRTTNPYDGYTLATDPHPTGAYQPPYLVLLTTEAV